MNEAKNFNRVVNYFRCMSRFSLQCCCFVVRITVMLFFLYFIQMYALRVGLNLYNLNEFNQALGFYNKLFFKKGLLLSG